MNIAQRILAGLYRVFGPPVRTFDVHGDLRPMKVGKSTGQRNLEMPANSIVQELRPTQPAPLRPEGRPISDFPELIRRPATVDELIASLPPRAAGYVRAAQEGAQERPLRINYMVLQEYAYANDLDYDELCAVVRRAVLNR